MNTYNLLILFVIILLLLLLLINIQRNTEIKTAINITDAKKLLEQNYYDYIIDVRTEKEWKEGRYPGAIHIPLNKLYEGVKLYELNSRYLIYCETGRRASMGAELMKQMGFKNVHFLVGNYRLLS